MAVKTKVKALKGATQQSVNETEDTQQDYAAYAYRPDSTVVISGDLFQKLNALLMGLVKEEVKVYFAQKDTYEEYMNQEPMILQTEKGFACNEILGLLGMAHEENVDAGNAIPISELQKPNLVPVNGRESLTTS